MSYNKNSLNRVMLIGRLGQDPETKYTPSGAAVCSFSLATTTAYKQGDENKEQTEWHRIVAWRQLAEIIGQYCKKGHRIYVEGKLATRTWDDKDGNKRYTTEIVAEQVQFLESKKQDSAEPENDPWMPPASEPRKNDDESDLLPF